MNSSVPGLPLPVKMQAFFLAGILMLFSQTVFAQDKDSVRSRPRVSVFFNNIFTQVMHAVTVSKKDSVIKATVLNTKSEQPFQRYEGKIIRNILTDALGFDRSFTDTTNRIRYLGARIMNRMHTDTRAWVIRNNLFFSEGSVLNPYLMSDNERFLRSIDYIQDARILILPIMGKRDSVDVLVVTKDLFSISGGIDVSGINRVKIKAAENNLMGMGQRVQLTTLVDSKRKPSFGYEFLYTQNSIAHSFVNASIGYTVINTGPSTGTEEEKAFYINAQRDLVSPYSHLAGGLIISYNQSENFYRKPDSFFYKYRYNVYDGWIGYNLGITKLLKSNNSIRDRSFLAFRYMRTHFNEVPEQVGEAYDRIYNSKQALLAEFTLFRQNFYKTNYIYGFGTTEDIPYGINVALTGGWYKQLQLARPYAGINANHYMAADNGSFMQSFFRSGVFWDKGRMEDVRILMGANFFSKIYYYQTQKIREYLRFSYTRLINRITTEPLRIDNQFGLQSFSSDSALGNQRLSLYAETFMFTNYKLFGFRMAPFAFTDISWLSSRQGRGLTGFYSGLGGGVRTRNENLIFGTMELRFIYFPTRAEKYNGFKISFNSNIRFRYSTRYVKAPDIIQVNSDDSNNSYGLP